MPHENVKPVNQANTIIAGPAPMNANSCCTSTSPTPSVEPPKLLYCDHCSPEGHGTGWTSFTDTDRIDSTQCDQTLIQMIEDDAYSTTTVTNTNIDNVLSPDYHMLQLLESIPLDAILSPMIEDPDTVERRLYAEKGYIILGTICDTLQGTLLKARHLVDLSNGYQTTQFCAIKRVSKALHRQRITNLDGSSFCVAEDIQKEGEILRKWSQQSTSIPVREFMVRYIDYFESAEYIYLVTGLVASLLFTLRYLYWFDSSTPSRVVPYYNTFQYPYCGVLT